MRHHADLRACPLCVGTLPGAFVSDSTADFTVEGQSGPLTQGHLGSVAGLL